MESICLMFRFCPPTPLPPSPEPPEAPGGIQNIEVAIPKELFKGRASREVEMSCHPSKSSPFRVGMEAIVPWVWGRVEEAFLDTSRWHDRSVPFFQPEPTTPGHVCPCPRHSSSRSKPGRSGSPSSRYTPPVRKIVWPYTWYHFPTVRSTYLVPIAYCQGGH